MSIFSLSQGQHVTEGMLRISLTTTQLSPRNPSAAQDQGPQTHRPRFGEFSPKKNGSFEILPSFANESTKLDETRRIESRCRLSHFCHFESTRVEMRVDLVSFLLDVLSKLYGAVPKLKEHFLRCIPHQAHDSQHCICPWMLFQQLHFVLVAFILMGRSDLDDVINC